MNPVKKRNRQFINYRKPKSLMILASIVTAVIFGLILSYFWNSKVDDKAGNGDYKVKEQPVNLKNFIISENDVVLQNKNKVKVELIMTKGTYFDIDHTVPGGGTYDANYLGKYELRVLNKENKCLSSFDLNKDWDMESINFAGIFELLFSDYNGDDNPDFTIGTYGSSSMNLYYLYSIDNKGKVRRIIKEPIANMSKDFSVVFESDKENGEYLFLTYIWNNATAEGGHSFYRWNNNLGLFELKESTKNLIQEDASDDDTVLTMEELIQLVKKDKLTLEDFVSYTNSMNKNYGEDDLNYHIIFLLRYQGEEYQLDVSYTKKDKSLDAVSLTRLDTGEMILLESSDIRYSVNKNITAFINSHIYITNYLSYKLPKPLVDGKYNALINDMGGNLFLRNGKAESSNASAPEEWYAAGGVSFVKQESVTFEKGQLISVSLGGNHMQTIGKPMFIKGLKEQAVLEEVEYDLYTPAEVEKSKEEGNPIPEKEQTSKMWYVFFAREDGDIAYALFLNEKYYDKKDILALARSVEFYEDAFYR